VPEFGSLLRSAMAVV